MRKGLMGGVLVGMMAFGGLGLALADAPKAGGNDQAAAMAKWQKAATPGDQHKMLAKAVGKADAASKEAWRCTERPCAGIAPLVSPSSPASSTDGSYARTSAAR